VATTLKARSMRSRRSGPPISPGDTNNLGSMVDALASAHSRANTVGILVRNHRGVRSNRESFRSEGHGRNRGRPDKATCLPTQISGGGPLGRATSIEDALAVAKRGQGKCCLWSASLDRWHRKKELTQTVVVRRPHWRRVLATSAGAP